MGGACRTILGQAAGTRVQEVTLERGARPFIYFPRFPRLKDHLLPPYKDLKDFNRKARWISTGELYSVSHRLRYEVAPKFSYVPPSIAFTARLQLFRLEGPRIPFRPRASRGQVEQNLRTGRSFIGGTLSSPYLHCSVGSFFKQQYPFNVWSPVLGRRFLRAIRWCTPICSNGRGSCCTLRSLWWTCQKTRCCFRCNRTPILWHVSSCWRPYIGKLTLLDDWPKLRRYESDHRFAKSRKGAACPYFRRKLLGRHCVMVSYALPRNYFCLHIVIWGCKCNHRLYWVR